MTESMIINKDQIFERVKRTAEALEYLYTNHEDLLLELIDKYFNYGKLSNEFMRFAEDLLIKAHKPEGILIHDIFEMCSSIVSFDFILPMVTIKYINNQIDRYFTKEQPKWFLICEMDRINSVMNNMWELISTYKEFKAYYKLKRKLKVIRREFETKTDNLIAI